MTYTYIKTGDKEYRVVFVPEVAEELVGPPEELVDPPEVEEPETPSMPTDPVEPPVLEVITVVVFESEDEVPALVEAYLEMKAAPPAVSVPQYPRLPVRDFLSLFTYDEKLAIKAATRASDALGLWYDEMLAAQFITAEDPDTLMGLAVMVEAGLITAKRNDEIIARMQPAVASYGAAPV